MPTVIDELTDTRRQSMAPFVAGRVRDILDCIPLTRQRREAAEESIRRCYEAAGLPWPGTVVWVSSPLVGDAATRSAAASIRQRRIDEAARARPRLVRACAAVNAVADAAGRVLVWAANVLAFTFGGAVVAGGVAGCTGIGMEDVGWAAVVPITLVGAAIGAFVGAWIGILHRRTVRIEAVNEARKVLLNAAVAEVDQTGRRIRAACVDAVETLLVAEVRPQTDAAVRKAVQGPVDDAVTPVWTAIDAGVRQGGNRGEPAPLDHTTRAVRTAVGPHGPLLLALDPPSGLDDLIAARDSGQLARLTWWRRHGGLNVEGWDRFDAFADACRLWWWPHPDFVVVSQPPVELYVERSASGAYRMHRPDGPAVVWRHGFRLWFWHGVNVPADLIEHGWDVDRIHRHDNSEIRRAAIEHMGWLTYIERAHLSLLASAPDPGNAPHDLLRSPPCP